jgi:hypothetical protein
VEAAHRNVPILQMAAMIKRLAPRTAFMLAAVGLGLFLALGAGAIATSRHFDGLYGQDAYAYFDYATASVRQSLVHVSALEPFFWPPGYPLLVAATSLALGPVPLSGQLVSLLMGALVPILTVLLVYDLWPDDAPLAVLAGALVAVCGQLWQSSVVVMSDTTGLALATFSAVALVRYARTRHGAWLVVASAAIAYATLARWIYGLVAVPFAMYAVLVLLQRPRHSAVIDSDARIDGRINPISKSREGRGDGERMEASEVGAPTTRESAPLTDARPLTHVGVSSAAAGSASGPEGFVPDTDQALPADPNARQYSTTVAPPTGNIVPDAAPVVSPRIAVLHTLVALLVAAVILVPAVAQPLIGLIRDPARPATFAGNFQVYSWSPLNAVHRDFFTADGHLAYSQPNGVYYAEAPANFAYFGPLLALWILPGVWAARRWGLRNIVLIGGWGGVVFAFHAGAPWQNFRFALAYLPPAAILAAAGLWLAWRWFDIPTEGEKSVGSPSSTARTFALRVQLRPAHNRGVATLAWFREAATQGAGPPIDGSPIARVPLSAAHSDAGQASEQRAGAPRTTARPPAGLPAADARSAAAPPADDGSRDPEGLARHAPASYEPARLERRPGRRRAARTALRTIVATCILVGLLTTAAAAARLVERFIDTKDQELALVDWVHTQMPPNAELFTFGPTLAFRHYSSVPTFDLFDVSAPEVQGILSDPAPHYLLVDIGSVESQWLNQTPSTNYHLLRDEIGLEELGTDGGYTLYRVDVPAQ